jgi:agmatine deiminase
MTKPKAVVVVAIVILCALWTAADDKKPQRVSADYLAQIPNDETNPLPRFMTPEERLLPPLPMPLFPVPPSGAVYTPAEYSRNDGLLIRWGYPNDVLTQITVYATTGTDATVYVVVADASTQSSATSILSGAGANMSQVEFILYSSNSIWIRDYGPRFILEDASRAMVDHVYNRPRPLDDAFPDFLSTLWGEPQYDIPLEHGGGNFHLTATGEAFMSDLVLTENPGLTEQDVKDLFADYENLDLTIYPGFPTWYDSTQHIDMWMFPADDNRIIIGEYGTGDVEPHAITEAATADLISRGYTVIRTPGWSSGGTHYTYTNAVVLNEVVMISEFSGYPTENAAAVAAFTEAFPGREIVTVDSSEIIQYAGAIHCVVMHVPTAEIPIFHDQFEPDGLARWSSVYPSP